MAIYLINEIAEIPFSVMVSFYIILFSINSSIFWAAIDFFKDQSYGSASIFFIFGIVVLIILLGTLLNF